MSVKFLELSRLGENDGFGKGLGNMKAFGLVSLAAEKLHSVFDIRRQIAAAYEMGRHRPATFGFDVINHLRPQCVQSPSWPVARSFTALKMAGAA